jgi:3-oxoacyl-[acyl-carrier protein] reductase
MLQHKNAIIYGAGPSLGGTVAQALAAAGARVFVTHRRIEAAEEIVNKIIAAGGKAEAASVDAMDKDAIDAHMEAVVLKAGKVDLSFNLIGVKGDQDIPLVNMPADDFLEPIQGAMHTQFLTATAAGRIMMKQGSGVILSLTATPGGIGYAMVGGFGPACCAIESLSRDLAAELGPYGVRVVNIRSAGSPDSRPFKEVLDSGNEEMIAFIEKLADDTMLKQLPLMEDIANTAVFLASDMAAKITGVTIDVTAGTTAALNYKVSRPAFFRK